MAKFYTPTIEDYDSKIRELKEVAYDKLRDWLPEIFVLEYYDKVDQKEVPLIDVFNLGYQGEMKYRTTYKFTEKLFPRQVGETRRMPRRFISKEDYQKAIEEEFNKNFTKFYFDLHKYFWDEENDKKVLKVKEYLRRSRIY